MHHSIIGSLIAAGPVRRTRRDATALSAREALFELSGHHLRDIGFIREHTIAPRRHLIWM